MQQLLREDLNFLITNRIPRHFVTRLAGWFSRIESPALTRVSIAIWSWFGGDLHLEESEHRAFRSLHACFTRRLRPDARPVAMESDVLVSPCDAEVGAVGRISSSTLIQAKGLTYQLEDLIRDEVLAARHDGGMFITLRLKSSMYHRFHAPCAGRLQRVRFISGDTWNVNPIAVRRIERLFCRNERLVVELDADDPALTLTLVPVAAILVASIRLHAIPFPFNQDYRGSTVVDCAKSVSKGEELGYFENGSTIIVLVSGPFELAESVKDGAVIRMGQPLLKKSNVSRTATRSPSTLS